MIVAIFATLVLEIIITAASLILPVMIIRYFWDQGNSLFIALSLGTSLYLFAIISCLISVIIYRILPKPKLGSYKIQENPAEFIKFIVLFSLRLYILKTPASWATLLPGGAPFFSLAGSKLGQGVNAACFDNILDFHSVDIGNNVILGFNSLLSGHMRKKDDIFVFGEIKIADEAIIGVNAVIWPDVQIGTKAVVMPGAIVYPGTRIGDNELWGGNPAVKMV